MIILLANHVFEASKTPSIQLALSLLLSSSSCYCCCGLVRSTGQDDSNLFFYQVSKSFFEVLGSVDLPGRVNLCYGQNIFFSISSILLYLLWISYKGISNVGSSRPTVYLRGRHGSITDLPLVRVQSADQTKRKKDPGAQIRGKTPIVRTLG